MKKKILEAFNKEFKTDIKSEELAKLKNENLKKIFQWVKMWWFKEHQLYL